MWSRLREAAAGIAEQAGLEVPGLDSAATVVADLSASAGDAATAVVGEVGASDALDSVIEVADSAVPTELVSSVTDAAASAGEMVTGVVGEATTTASGLLDPLQGG